MRPDPLNRLRLAPEQMSLYCGTYVFVANRYGYIQAGVDGLYHQQTRFLSRLVPFVNNKPLKPVSTNAVSACSGISYYLTASPDGAEGGPPGQDPQDEGGEIVQKGIEVQVNTHAGGGAYQDVIVTNRTLKPITVTIDWAIEADFADLEEVTNRKRQQTAPVQRRWRTGGPGEGTLTLKYDHPRLDHATTIGITSPGPVFNEGDTIRTAVTLEPQVPAVIRLAIGLVFLGEPIRPWYGPDGEPTADHADAGHGARWLGDCSRLTTDQTIVQNAWDRAVADLASLHALEGPGDERFTPLAGIPKYTALFGRDSLVTGLQSALLSPVTLGGTLRRVRQWTAQRYDDSHDAEPGKIVHQHQLSPLAILGENPFRQYYGDYSAPALFIIGAAAHFAHTGDRDAFASVRDNVFATLDWMDRDGDRDGDGFYEYDTKAGKKGIKNQGWKDSGQAILHEDGRFVHNPIAVAEIQGLYYAAKQALAGVLMCLGETARAEVLLQQAAALKRRFNEAFWLPDRNYFAMALGPDKQPIRSVASDPGSCLTYGIVDAAKAAAVRDRLFEPDMFSGWGIRTLSSSHPAYNPLGYHLGSVWPVSNGNICFGLRRYGFTEACHRLAEALFDATLLFDYERLPEVFGGHPRDRRHPHPGIYPDSCSPQAWSASAVIHVVHALAGITPLAPLGALVIDPALPSWLPRLMLRNITVGKGRVDVALHRTADGATHHEVLAGGEGLRIVRPKAAASEGEDRFPHLLAALA